MLRLGRQRTYGLLLALIALVILGAGYYFKPAKAANQRQTVPDISSLQSELERLRQLAQRNSLRNTSARFSEAASLAAPFLIYAPESMRTGVVWEDGSVLLPSGDFPAQKSLKIRTGATVLEGHPDVWGAGVPVQRVRVPDDKLPAMPDISTVSSLSPGAWVLAVRLDQHTGIQFRPGIFTGQSSIQCGTNLLPAMETSAALDADAAGSSVFDLDGNLIGMLVQCDRRVAVIPVEAIRAILRDTANPEYNAILHSGMEVVPVSEKWKPLVSAGSSLLVTDIWLGWPADQAGILAGDVIVSANGNKVNTPAELSRALQLEEPVNLKVVRKGRSVALKLLISNVSESPSLEFATDAGVELTTVFPGSKSQRSGLRPGDRILSIDGVRATRSSVLRAFGTKSANPLLATVQRGNRLFVTVVPR